MTDREKAIIMAYTGVVTLTGDKLDVFYKYVAELIGRPVYTHEFEALLDTIKEASFTDFCVICKTEQESVRHSWWKYYHKQNKAVCMSCSFERDLDDNFGAAVCCPNCGAKMDAKGAS